MVKKKDESCYRKSAPASCCRLESLLSVDERGQMVLPKDLRDKAGIKAGDNILKVDGKSTKELKLWEAVQKMRGAQGTKVILTIYRKGFKEPKDFTLVRDIIPIESVYHVTLEPGYGYVRLTNFRDNTTADLEAALKDMEAQKQPLKALVLDLRNNPGGLMNQAVSVADLFIDKGEIVSMKGRLKQNNKVYTASKIKKKREYPMVVLINSGSASASEIVAGALQDHKRALLVGSTTFGKGSVQTVEPLRNGCGIKLTIARYYTPNGRSIQAEGIVPDIVMQEGYDTEKASKKERGLKEKDLENHLAPEGTDNAGKSEDVKTPEGSEDDEEGTEEEYKSFGTLTPEMALKDHQVSRALEILKGHVILSKTGS